MWYGVQQSNRRVCIVSTIGPSSALAKRPHHQYIYGSPSPEDTGEPIYPTTPQTKEHSLRAKARADACGVHSYEATRVCIFCTSKADVHRTLNNMYSYGVSSRAEVTDEPVPIEPGNPAYSLRANVPPGISGRLARQLTPLQQVQSRWMCSKGEPYVITQCVVRNSIKHSSPYHAAEECKVLSIPVNTERPGGTSLQTVYDQIPHV